MKSMLGGVLLLGVLTGCAAGDPCNTYSCAGCCFAGVCYEGFEDSRCGGDAQACQTCSQTQVCRNRRCEARTTGTGGGSATGGGGGFGTGGGFASGGGSAAGGGVASCGTVAAASCQDDSYVTCGGVCCEAAYPYYCASKNLCYATAAGAAAECGTSCRTCRPATPQHRVSCSGLTTHPSSVPDCTCTAQDSNAGSTVYSGIACSTTSDMYPNFCCRSSGYPATGSCSCWGKVTWVCTALDQYRCECNYYPDQNVGLLSNKVSVCRSAGHTPTWICCADDYRCGCYDKVLVSACASDKRTVSECTTPSQGTVPPAPTTCATGFSMTTNCRAP